MVRSTLAGGCRAVNGNWEPAPVFTPQPAAAARSGADLEPVVLAVEDLQFRAVVDRTDALRDIERPIANGDLRFHDDGDLGGLGLVPSRARARADRHGEDRQEGQRRPQAAYESGSPLEGGRQQEDQPEDHRSERLSTR